MTLLALWQIALLALIQGLAELLPVSSSAHVIFVERLLGLDPSAPSLTFLLVMLHTGTMFAVLVYFWRRWAAILRSDRRAAFLKGVVIATLCTAVLGFGLKVLIEKIVLEKMLGHSKGEVEHLFGNLPMIAIALAAAGVLIFIASRWEARLAERHGARGGRDSLTGADSAAIGLVQGLCLPFRGFSRSGATISTAFFRGISRALAEDFSFALAVVLTPPVIVRETLRLVKSAREAGTPLELGSLLGPGMVGMVFSFLAGLLALRWLSSWLEKGRWHLFGIYCIVFAAVVLAYHFTAGSTLATLPPS